MAKLYSVDSKVVTVGTGLTVLADIRPPNGAVAEIFAEIKNLGATAFNAFVVEMRFSEVGDWMTVAFDFTQVGAMLPYIDPNNDLATLAGGTNSVIKIQPISAPRVRFSASVASGSTTAQVLGQALLGGQ